MTDTVTIQTTAKRLKAHILISTVLFWGGLIILFTLKDTALEASAIGGVWAAVSVLAMGAGLLIYVVAKFRIWWNHA